MSLFSPQKIELSQAIIYAWMTSNNPNSIPDFVYSITSTPKLIRQQKRLSPQAHFTRITGGTCHAFAQVPHHYADQFIDELTTELCALSYPMFSHIMGEPLFSVEEEPTQLTTSTGSPQQRDLWFGNSSSTPKNKNTQPRTEQNPEPNNSPPTNHLASFPDLLSTPPHPIYLLSIMHRVNKRLRAAELNRQRVNKHRSSPPPENVDDLPIIEPG